MIVALSTSGNLLRDWVGLADRIERDEFVDVYTP
jgi:hypothetical protein